MEWCFGWNAPLPLPPNPRNASALSDVGLKNTYKIGYLERVVFWMFATVLYSIKGGHVEKHWHSNVLGRGEGEPDIHQFKHNLFNIC